MTLTSEILIHSDQNLTEIQLKFDENLARIWTGSGQTPSPTKPSLNFDRIIFVPIKSINYIWADLLKVNLLHNSNELNRGPS